jgi:hypothetical protein
LSAYRPFAARSVMGRAVARLLLVVGFHVDDVRFEIGQRLAERFGEPGVELERGDYEGVGFRGAGFVDSSLFEQPCPHGIEVAVGAVVPWDFTQPAD